MTETIQLVNILLLEKKGVFDSAVKQLLTVTFPCAKLIATDHKEAYLDALYTFNPHCSYESLN